MKTGMYNVRNVRPTLIYKYIYTQVYLPVELWCQGQLYVRGQSAGPTLTQPIELQQLSAAPANMAAKNFSSVYRELTRDISKLSVKTFTWVLIHWILSSLLSCSCESKNYHCLHQSVCVWSPANNNSSVYLTGMVVITSQLRPTCGRRLLAWGASSAVGSRSTPEGWPYFWSHQRWGSLFHTPFVHLCVVKNNNEQLQLKLKSCQNFIPNPVSFSPTTMLSSYLHKKRDNCRDTEFFSFWT